MDDLGVATVTLNNASKLNALTVELGAEFRSAVAHLAANRHLRAVLENNGRNKGAGLLTIVCLGRPTGDFDWSRQGVFGWRRPGLFARAIAATAI